MKEYVTIEEVHQAYKDCRRHKGSTEGFVKYQMDFLSNNYRLYQELNTMTYEIGRSKAFCVTRPKVREVFCAQFRDRIVHHLLANKFLPILEAEMIDDAYACRKGKGTEYCIERVRKHIERVSMDYTKEAWVLKCDLRGFFMSINRHLIYRILEDAIRKRYDGDDVEWWLWLWRKVVLHAPENNCVRVGDLSLWDKLPRNKSLFTSGGKGLPIGNLPSQILANLLLSAFDKWIIGRIGKDGGYGRYVDDFVAVSRDKALLLELLQDAGCWLLVNLGLTLHPRKISLQEAMKGVRFIGVMIRPHRQTTNPRTLGSLHEVVSEWNYLRNPSNAEAARFIRRFNSYFGIICHRNSYGERVRAWKMAKHKDKFYCLNMCCLKIRQKQRNYE